MLTVFALLTVLTMLAPPSAARAQAPASRAPTTTVANIRVAFRQLTIADGLSQGAISSIVQDSRGFMWFGTKDGLNRYDGHQFVVFRHDAADSTSVSSSEITAVFEDSRRRLWVASHGGVDRFDRTRERFEHVASAPTRDVTAFAEDRDGSIWIAAGVEGLFRLNANRTGPVIERFAHSPTDASSIAGGRVRTVLVDRRGDLWVGSDSGLTRRAASDRRAGAFTRVSVSLDAPNGSIDKSVSALHEDVHGRLWIGSRAGVSLFDSARTRMQQFYHRYRTFRYGWGEAVGLEVDRSGALWMTTRAELMRLEPSTGEFTYLRHDAQDPASINSDLTTALYRDRSDVVWVGTNGYGINVHDPKAERFHTFRRPESWPSRLSGFSVYTLFEDRAGTIWIDGGLLYGWNRSTGSLRRFETTSDRPNDFGNTGVWSVIEDSPGVLWAGTYQGLYRYEIATGRSRQYRHDPRDSTGLRDQTVFDVFRDRDGAIWAVTENFLSRLADTARGRFESWRIKPVATGGRWIFPSMIQDAQGALWLGSDQGLARFDPRTGTFRHYRHDPRDPRSLSNDAIRAILPDPQRPDRYLWIGTAGGGLNRLDVDSGTFRSFTERDGLPNDVVYGVLPDSSGRLWISTNRGLSRFDPATRTFRNYDANDGLQGNEFNSGAAFRSRSGELFFGGTEGFSYFRPETVTDNPHVPPVAITGFRRGNRYETVRDSGTALRTTISEADTLRLSYRDAVLTFDYAALEYSAPAKNRFAYRLVGFNNDWFEAGAVRAATFTNLPPGRYTFQVRASNNDGVWNGQGTSLALIIMPPWWRTWWAYALYSTIAFALLVLARRYEVGRLRLASRLEVEHMETEQLRRLDRARSQLFANVSHEFRTPLTLTLGPLDDLRAGAHGPLSSSAIEQVDLARRNAARVLDLINEILELARAEAGRVTVRARRLDLSPFVDEVARSFLPLAERKAIAYDIQTPAEPIVVVGDPELLERALSNVLANAFKFTPDGGTVRVILARGDGTALVTVRDNGPGIPAADVDLVFDRFHRAASTAGAHPGTGIGLALARELVLRHGGSIAVESDEGFGSTFLLTLPTGSTHLLPEQLAEDGAAPWIPRTRPPSTSADAQAVEATPMDTRASADEDDVTTVLVVDDNADIRAYVARHLSPLYRVLEAADGQQGLELVRRHPPDLVLSDVMMPVMDGYALCRALKSDPETDFVPVILLTARAEAEDRLAGLTERADDYLTKPFDVPELLARIANTIATRRRLRERYAGTGASISTTAPASSSRVASAVLLPVDVATVDVAAGDRRLLDQVRAAITANMGDESFTVERLAAAVAQSRGNLHRRLREQGSETPSDLIRRMRLERAADLLDAGAGSVAEVAYAVGFKSVAHFSNAFHALHGARPSGWRGRMR